MNRASGLAASFSWFYKTVIGKQSSERDGAYLGRPFPHRIEILQTTAARVMKKYHHNEGDFSI